MPNKMNFYSKTEIREITDIVKLYPKGSKERVKFLNAWAESNKRSLLGVQYKAGVISKSLTKTPTKVTVKSELPAKIKVEKTTDFQNGSLSIPIKTISIVNNNLVITW